MSNQSKKQTKTNCPFCKVLLPLIVFILSISILSTSLVKPALATTKCTTVANYAKYCIDSEKQTCTPSHTKSAPNDKNKKKAWIAAYSSAQSKCATYRKKVADQKKEAEAKKKAEAQKKEAEAKKKAEAQKKSTNNNDSKDSTPAVVDTGPSNICEVSNIPDSLKAGFDCDNESGGTKEDGLPGAIKSILQNIILVSGFIAVVFIVVGGVQYMTSGGDANKVKRGKDTILYACIGLIICTLAFAIVNFTIGLMSNKNENKNEDNDEKESLIINEKDIAFLKK